MLAIRVAKCLGLVVNVKTPLSFYRIDRFELFLVHVGCLHVL